MKNNSKSSKSSSSNKNSRRNRNKKSLVWPKKSTPIKNDKIISKKEREPKINLRKRQKPAILTLGESTSSIAMAANAIAVANALQSHEEDDDEDVNWLEENNYNPDEQHHHDAALDETEIFETSSTYSSIVDFHPYSNHGAMTHTADSTINTHKAHDIARSSNNKSNIITSSSKGSSVPIDKNPIDYDVVPRGTIQLQNRIISSHDASSTNGLFVFTIAPKPGSKPKFNHHDKKRQA
mmetsp:Transcript_16908/g.23903  ORF Transcript_16908/g.23903 Transcript_16908/m.23903 type:complete len:237 (+) Transcript_16908:328-1038(+)